MADVQPSTNLFQVPRNEALSSYNYFDLVAGTGIQKFYGGNVFFLSGTSIVSGAILSDNIFYSGNITSKAGVNSTSYQNPINRNFDLSFNTTRTINGNIIANIPVGVNPLGNSNNSSLYLDLYLYKVDTAGTETLIVSGSTTVFGAPTASAANLAYSRIESAKLAVSNQTFKKNEKLRLQVRVWCKNNAGASLMVAGIGHDPMNRADKNEYVLAVANVDGPIIQSTDTGLPKYAYATDTNLIVQIPFKLDVEI